MNAGKTNEAPTLKSLFTLKEDQEEVPVTTLALIADIVMKLRKFDGEEFKIGCVRQYSWVLSTLVLTYRVVIKNARSELQKISCSIVDHTIENGTHQNPF